MGVDANIAAARVLFEIVTDEQNNEESYAPDCEEPDAIEHTFGTLLLQDEQQSDPAPQNFCNTMLTEDKGVASNKFFPNPGE